MILFLVTLCYFYDFLLLRPLYRILYDFCLYYYCFRSRGIVINIIHIHLIWRSDFCLWLFSKICVCMYVLGYCTIHILWVKSTFLCFYNFHFPTYFYRICFLLFFLDRTDVIIVCFVWNSVLYNVVSARHVWLFSQLLSSSILLIFVYILFVVSGFYRLGLWLC